MCIIRAFNYIITIFHIQKEKKVEKTIINLDTPITHAQIFNERDHWRKICMEQSHNYVELIKKLNKKLDKYKQIDLIIAEYLMDVPANVWYRFLYTHKYHITTQGKEHQSENCMKVVRPYLQFAETIRAKPSLPPASNESTTRMNNLLYGKDGKKGIKKYYFA